MRNHHQVTTMQNLRRPNKTRGQSGTAFFNGGRINHEFTVCPFGKAKWNTISSEHTHSLSALPHPLLTPPQQGVQGLFINARFTVGVAGHGK